MFSKAFQRKYALTDQGLKNTKSGAFWTVVTNLVVMGGMGILYLLMGGFMGTLTDGAPLPGAALPAVLTVGFVLLSFVTHLQQYRATYGLVYGEVKTTRLRLAERLRKLPLGYFGKRDLADLTETIMGDVNRMEHVWSHVLGYLYGAYISTAIIALCLLFYDWRLMIACLWGVPVAFGLLFGSRKIAAQNSEVTKKAALRVSDGIQEALENVREIRAANQEERYLAGLYEKIDQHEKVTIRGELTTGLFVNAASVIMRLGVATTILTGASLILSGQIDFMVLFLFLLVITRVYAPFDQSLALIAEMFISQVSADRINEIYETPIAKGAETFRPQGHDIVFDHVTFGYGETPVLQDVSFTIPQGSTFAILGGTGSGKSTLVHLLDRLYDLQEGRITIGSVDIRSFTRESLRSQIGLVLQEPFLFSQTIRENIAATRPGAPQEELRSAAAIACVDEAICEFPEGYETLVGERGVTLSGGQKQRVAIARMLMQRAPIMVFDDSLSAVDAETDAKIRAALHESLGKATVLLISHRVTTLMQADCILVLDGGRVSELGTHAELIAKPGIYRDIYDIQMSSDDRRLLGKEGV